MQNTELVFDWAPPMADDIAAAGVSVMVTALSLHPPRKQSGSNISQLWDALRSAVNNGASVSFFLPLPSRSHPATAMNGDAGQRLHAMGVKVHFLRVDHLLHAKTVSIDGRISWVGSGNWTAAASTFNREAYIRAECPSLAASLAAHWLRQVEQK